jgi:hypothetical protein
LIKGSQWDLSSFSDGVEFDFFGTGIAITVPWPEARGGDGWLVLPDENDQVPNAKYMFGNTSPGADRSFTCPGGYTAPGGANGFRALSQYDTNHDCVIDADDPIWSKLMIWYDYQPRNGKVDPGELVPVSKVLRSISLRYVETPIKDANGNSYRYCSSPSVCDVFLVLGK